MVSLKEALILLRVRWQVELLFKLWKSHAQVDAWRSHNPWRIFCDVYATLIGVVIRALDVSDQPLGTPELQRVQGGACGPNVCYRAGPGAP